MLCKRQRWAGLSWRNDTRQASMRIQIESRVHRNENATMSYGEHFILCRQTHCLILFISSFASKYQVEIVFIRFWFWIVRRENHFSSIIESKSVKVKYREIWGYDNHSMYLPNSADSNPFSFADIEIAFIFPEYLFWHK